MSRRWRSSCCWASPRSWCGAPARRSPPSAPPTAHRWRPPARPATCPRASSRRGAPRAPPPAHRSWPGPPWSPATAAPSKGHDAATGDVAWSYHRDLALCTVGAGFPGTDDGDGHALALYAGRTGWCSELTALHPSSGTRADASNPDMRPGVATARRRLATSPRPAPTYLEVWRSDLVRTLEYGDVPTPVQPGKQPRPECTYGSTAVSSDRIGVIERCPDAPTDRLTVLTPDGSEGRRHTRGAVLGRAARRRRCARGALGRPGGRRGARPAAPDRATTRPGCS